MSLFDRPPARRVYVEGIGQALPWGDWWKLIYDDCGHQEQFPRTGHRLSKPAEVEAEVRRHYPMCICCAWAAARSQPHDA
jgi:hypothetical protein